MSDGGQKKANGTTVSATGSKIATQLSTNEYTQKMKEETEAAKTEAEEAKATSKSKIKWAVILTLAAIAGGAFFLHKKGMLHLKINLRKK